MIRLSGYNNNDIINGCDEGICISVWLQGCPHHCKGCHNPGTWNFTGGDEVSEQEIIERIDKDIDNNNVKRNLTILGGEPLAEQNRNFTAYLINIFKKKYPDKKIFLWTGYTYEEIKKMDIKIQKSLLNTSLLITDRFILEKRDISLKYRGSSNQRVWKPSKFLFFKYLKNITKTI